MFNAMSLKVKLIVFAIAISISFGSGWKVNGWRLGQQIVTMQNEQLELANKNANQIILIERLNREKSEAISAKVVAEKKAQETKATTITKKVIEYVQSPDTGVCTMPDGWVQLHDSAATGMPTTSDSTSTSSRASEGDVTDREALIVVTENYNRCRENAIKHRGLIEWATSLSTQSKEK